ncbi:MAG: CHAT domain-containing protein, partial [Bacteroidota bacterium]
GAFVTEARRVSYLTSSRTLARPRAASMPNDSLVVFAAVDYDAPATGIRTGADDAANPSGLADAGGQAPAQRGGGFAALPGTEAEATMLATLGLPVRSFLGAEATEASLLALDAPGRLHIATHGFFLNDAAALETITGARSGTLSGSLGSGGAGEDTPVDEEQFADPLLRSGLALAGANRIGTDRVADDPDATTDGIATAYELASLDLRGTDLVVLSACETGLGEIEAGEGVLGLRRAFEVAGAETVVMSLWKVPDAATAALMTAFYGALDDGRTKAEALREAAAVVRAEERWAHPYWWAAFVLAGATE